MGPIIPPIVNASMSIFDPPHPRGVLEEEFLYEGRVHVKDVALAHILHLCVEAIRHYGDFAGKVAELYHMYNVPDTKGYPAQCVTLIEDGSKKLMDLGIQFNYLVVSNAYLFYSFFRLP
ncbi:hypothetical protein MKW92_023084 [Papaver armeniacum]|nr:hypothetical protein MKW92_023084 [Papaver armeniacum]